MVADILTKALPGWKVKGHTAALGLRSACGGVEKCAMTSTCEGALTTGIPIGPNRAGAPGGSLGRGAHILKPEFLD